MEGLIMGEYGYTASDVTLGNLDKLSRESSKTGELRFFEISDVAVSAANACISLMESGLGIYDVLSFISDGITLGSYPISDTPLAESAAHLRSSVRMMQGLDRAAFADLFAERMRNHGRAVSEWDFLPTRMPEETFTYVKNRFSDEAYDVLSAGFADPRVKYSDSFKECARALEDGTASYCLVPLEEKGGARLAGIAELIYRHDFKINAVTPVFGFEGDADLKYALISKHFKAEVREPGDDRYLELRVSASAGAELSELLSVASYFGMSVYRINTVSIPFEGDSTAFFSLVLREGASGLVSLLTYISLFATEFVPVGLYKNLE
jgi:hypothetical protein